MGRRGHERIIIIPSRELQLAELEEKMKETCRTFPGYINGTVDIPGTNQYLDYDDRNPDMTPKLKSHNLETSSE